MAFSISRNEFEKIEALLGRSLVEEHETLSGYADIGELDLQDLRCLAKGSSIDAINYLLYRLGGRGGLVNASSYIGHVVKAGMSTQEWLEQFFKEA